VIHINCDRCERELLYEDDLAGSKIECPHCGDMNSLPAAAAADSDSASDSPRQAEVLDRPSKLGLPPDSGPEQRVLMVRQSVIRSKPIVAGLFALAPLAVTVLLWRFLPPENRPTTVLVALPLVGWTALAVWVMFSRLTYSLEVTNKRTVLRHGLLSRSSSEVLHDHVRNIEIDQTFMQRIMRVGKIGVSSSGQDGIEVQMDRIPNPRKIREIIDLYRPM